MTYSTQEIHIAELVIERLEKRKLECWDKPSPFIKPLWESTEIDGKIAQLKNIIKKNGKLER